ncbi:hypothetical protein [uncultured Microbacterium sp.]|nr:hypothetical protein [uncultured Microbacterium sp.]
MNLHQPNRRRNPLRSHGHASYFLHDPAPTEIYTLITIDGASFVLAPTQDADQLCEELESAAAGTGTVVRFEAAGHRIVRSLITPRSRVIITEEEVTLNSEDTVMSLSQSGNWDLL